MGQEYRLEQWEGRLQGGCSEWSCCNIEGLLCAHVNGTLSEKLVHQTRKDTGDDMLQSMVILGGGVLIKEKDVRISESPAKTSRNCTRSLSVHFDRRPNQPDNRSSKIRIQVRKTASGSPHCQ